MYYFDMENHNFPIKRPKIMTYIYKWSYNGYAVADHPRLSLNLALIRITLTLCKLFTSGASVMTMYGSDLLDWWNHAFLDLKHDGTFRRLCISSARIHGMKSTLLSRWPTKYVNRTCSHWLHTGFMNTFMCKPLANWLERNDIKSLFRLYHTEEIFQLTINGRF